MHKFDLAQLSLLVVLLVVLTPLLGQHMARVFQNQENRLTGWLGGLEKLTYRIAGVNANEDMSSREYAGGVLGVSVVSLILCTLIQMLQAHLPLNPQHLGGVSWDSALNTSVSFVTNTNWQGYSGETTMSHLTQMMALVVQNFVSAAVGLAVAVALARGLAGRRLGNFWVDLTRGLLYVLLPLSGVAAVVLMSQGVVQSFSAPHEVQTLEGSKQIIAVGPVATQEAIKMIGTNGGGFFNANSAHPFENPTPVTNFLQMLLIFLLPAALTYTFGSIVSARRHGWILFATMLSLFLLGTVLSLRAELMPDPVLGPASLMEGKETRFGVFGSILFSVITTDASCGAVNAMHSSLSPISGAITMINMMLGEVIFGGVGAGLYGMILFVLLTVFIAGLMVGRTPEYLGKKVEGREMTMVIVAVLAPCAVILLGTGLSVLLPAGLSSLSSAGPHGFSEILYAFTSAAANNGSAFAGLNANTVYYNLMLSLAMIVGRFAIILPVLAIAGSMSAKKIAPPSPGTFEVDTWLFAVLLVGVIVIVGALTFVPALALGPIVEHLLLLRGQVF